MIEDSEVDTAKKLQDLRRVENRLSHEKRIQVLSETLINKMTDLVGKDGTQSRIDELWAFYQKISEVKGSPE